MRILFSASIGIWLTACASLPAAITENDVISNAADVRAEISAQSAPVSQAISLYEAMARAVKSNLDHRVSMMEIDLARKDYNVSRYDMLPRVVANGSYYGRNNQPGSTSISLLSGRQSLEPSTATQRNIFTSDLSATWNILDFGLSKIRSQQLADEAMIYEERRRKAVGQIIQDVNRAYWRAVSAERLGSRLNALESDVRKAFDDSRTLYKSSQTAPMPALTYQRELLEMQTQTQRLMRDVAFAKLELAALMGLQPDHPFKLQMPRVDDSPRPLALSYEEMVGIALTSRPEVRETLYAKRIGKRAIKAVVLEALPSFEAFAGLDVSSNDFLFNQNWANYGARASWNLLKLFSIGKAKRKARAKAALDEQRGLAAALAVMTQVAVSRARYESLITEFTSAEQGAQVQSEIIAQMEALFSVGSASWQGLIRERMNTVLSEARRDALYAEMKEAAAQIYTSLGYDSYGLDILGNEDVATLAASLKKFWDGQSQAPGHPFKSIEILNVQAIRADSSGRFKCSMGLFSNCSHMSWDRKTPLKGV